jgi:hypothetical protein
MRYARFVERATAGDEAVACIERHGVGLGIEQDSTVTLPSRLVDEAPQ